MPAATRLILAFILAIASADVLHAATPREVEFFEKQVRPVLAQHCYECHGPQKQKAGLRLDSRAAVVKGSDAGSVIDTAAPERSRLLEVLRHDGDVKMPPKAKLPPAAIDALTAWVKMGTPWPAEAPAVAVSPAASHWAFRPVADPPLPPVKQANWSRNSIDRFVLARLEASGLPPSPTAERRALIRRVTFDLTGLPPTPAEVEAFTVDRSPDAWAKVVDRLLASPRYGERWARHWLDVARFADTKGYVFFMDANFPWAHTYRDYVIRAFNDDLTYDRFVTEQLAADKLGDRRALPALGFLTLGGRFMNNVHDILDDRIDVVTRGLMGLTVTCARCHDHKFDPIPQADYYGLYGVFASAAEPEVPPLFADPPATPEYEKFRAELEAREKKLTDFRQAQYEQLIAGAKARVAEYWLAVHAQGSQPVQDDFMLLADGPDINPTMLKRWRAQLDRARRGHDPALAVWHAFGALPEKDFGAKARELTQSWLQRIDLTRPLNPHVVFAFISRPPASMADVAKRYGELLNDVDRAWREAGRPERLADPALEQLRQVFHGPGAAPNLPLAQIDDLELFPDRPSQAKLQELRKAVEQWRISGKGAPPRAHALVDLPQPLEPRVFLRGNPNQPGPAATRHMPAVVAPQAPPFRDGSGRLELARAVVDPHNPLTARVFVNRVWLHLFGAGLVRTPGDFGVRSDPPSHPELLDHLATEFIRGGWSVKRLTRAILLSATYQQASDDRPACAKLDPENRLLWRANRRRLDFEATRDALLSVAGRLDATVGGPSARDVLSPASTRRTLYGFVDRLQVPGLYRAFDYPSPDATSPQRDATTIPQQALFLMNSPVAVEAARGLARRTAATADAGERVVAMYRLCYGRPPTAGELALGRAFVGDGAGPAWERYAQALLAANEFVFVD